jgi:hypothetical protein
LSNHAEIDEDIERLQRFTKRNGAKKLQELIEMSMLLETQRLAAIHDVNSYVQ